MKWEPVLKWQPEIIYTLAYTIIWIKFPTVRAVESDMPYHDDSNPCSKCMLHHNREVATSVKCRSETLEMFLTVAFSFFTKYKLPSMFKNLQIHFSRKSLSIHYKHLLTPFTHEWSETAYSLLLTIITHSFHTVNSMCPPTPSAHFMSKISEWISMNFDTVGRGFHTKSSHTM